MKQGDDPMSENEPKYPLQKLKISRAHEPSLPDKVSAGAVSRWLETDEVRMRVITFPPGHVGDHYCYKGHAIYVISGRYEMEVGDETVEWQAGDAFIIPDGVSHRSKNPHPQAAQIVMFDLKGGASKS
jgi:quercetin dioxygenase-like cupin family protein